MCVNEVEAVVHSAWVAYLLPECVGRRSGSFLVGPQLVAGDRHVVRRHVPRQHNTCNNIHTRILASQSQIGVVRYNFVNIYGFRHVKPNLKFSLKESRQY